MRHAGRRKPESPCWTARRLGDSKHARAHTRARTHAHTGTESTQAYTQEAQTDNYIQQKLPDAALNSHLKNIYISTDPDLSEATTKSQLNAICQELKFAENLICNKSILHSCEVSPINPLT